MSGEPERFYTVEEANAELERVRVSLERIRDARAALLRSATRLRRGARADGGGLDDAAYRESTKVLRDELEGLAADGIVLRDADSGIIDFPARREGRLVYLCWRPDEDRVAFWHEVDAGFPGRKPL